MSPVKLFVFGCIGVLGATIVGIIFRFAGTPLVDLYNADRGQGSIFTVGFFFTLDPVFFAFFVAIYGAYAKISKRRLSSFLVYFHFLISVAFTGVVLWFFRDNVDLYNPNWLTNWPPFLMTQARLFAISRVVFVIAQILFIVNLLFSWFFGRPIQSDQELMESPG